MTRYQEVDLKHALSQFNSKDTDMKALHSNNLALKLKRNDVKVFMHNSA